MNTSLSTHHKNSQSAPPIQWEQVPCNLCGHDEPQVYERERVPYFDTELEFQVVRCSHCGLVYTNPRLSDANAVYLLDEDYTDQDIEDHARAKEPVFRTALEHLQSLLHGNGSENRHMLLDIGCGGGHFMKLAQQQGFNVAGIEPAPQPAAYAHRHFGLEIFQSTIEETDLPPDSFDAITAFDVIEHVTDPKAVLQRCVSWLRPGGMMALRFPSANWQKFKATVYHMIPGCRQWSFGPAMHLFFFSQKTFSRLAVESGLEPLEFRLTPMEFGSTGSMRDNLKKVCGAAFNAVYKTTGCIPGNLEVYCRKPLSKKPSAVPSE